MHNHTELKLKMVVAALVMFGIASAVAGVLPDMIMLYVWLVVLFFVGTVGVIIGADAL